MASQAENDYWKDRRAREKADRKADRKAMKRQGQMAAGADITMAALKWGMERKAAESKFASAQENARFNLLLTDIEEAQLENSHTDQVNAMQRSMALQSAQMEATMAQHGVRGTGGTAGQLQEFAREQQAEDLNALRTQIMGRQLGLQVQRAQIKIGEAGAKDVMRAEKDAAMYAFANSAMGSARDAMSAGLTGGA